MYVCMYVCNVCICMYVCTHVRMYVCMCVCVCIFMQVSKFCMHAGMYTSMYACVYVGGRAAPNLKKWREISGKNMAGDLRGKYGGRFAGMIWLGRLEVNPNTAVNDAEQ